MSLRRLVTAAGVLATALTAALAAPAAGDDQDPKPGEVIVVAGNGKPGYSGDGWAARDARITGLPRLAVAPDGTLYIAGGRQLRVVGTDGVIDTVPGTRALRSPENDIDYNNGWIYSPSNMPEAAAVAPDGTLYIAGSLTIGRREQDGSITEIAGGGELDFDGDDGGDGGPATEALIDDPADIAVDAAGNVYVADRYHDRIRKIDPSGTISTIAGGGTLGAEEGEGGPATAVGIDDPTSVAVDSAGTVYFTQHDNPRLHRVAPDGTLGTVVGSLPEGYSGDGGPASAAGVGGRYGGIAVDADDNVYLADVSNGRIRMIDPAGIITTVGPAISAGDLAVTPDGDLLVAEEARVRRIVRDAEPTDDVQPVGRAPRWADRDPGTVVTVAGTGREPADTPDGGWYEEDLPPGPSHVATAPDGTVYFADPRQHQVGKVAPDGTVSVVAGTGDPEFGGDGGPAELARLTTPGGVAVAPDGSLYVADTGNHRVRRVDAKGIITTVAGTGGATDGADGAPATEAGLPNPRGLTFDAAGNLYLTAGEDDLVRRVDPAGIVTTVAGGGERWADDADGHPATEASLIWPEAVAVDGAGAVYFTEGWQYSEEAEPSVRVVRDGILTTAVGDPYRGSSEGSFAGDGGPATRAEINNPHGLAIGPDGSLYVADTFNNRVRRVDPNGVISTVAGTGEPAEKGDGGPATAAALLDPTGITVDAAGTVYVTSPAGGSIRRIDPAGTITTIARLTDPETDTAGSPATETAIQHPNSLAVDRAGMLYLATISGQVYEVDDRGTMSQIDTGGQYDLATGRDGSLYLAQGDGIDRRYPDGTMAVVGGEGPIAGPYETGQLASTAYEFDEVAPGPDGLYVTDDSHVYRIEPDRTLTSIVERAVDDLAVGPDGTLYLADANGNRVLTVVGDTVTTFAGNGSDYVQDDQLGDGGPATEANVRFPTDLAVAPDGTVYLSTLDGIRRVDPNGTIETVVSAAEVPNGTGNSPDGLALDAHGNLYYAESTLYRVRVVVRPGEMVFPGPFSWSTMWFGVNLAAVACVFVFLMWLVRSGRFPEVAGGGTFPRKSDVRGPWMCFHLRRPYPPATFGS